MVENVHVSLEQRGFLPAEHLVDKGYTDAQVLVDSQQKYGVTLIGPVADDPSWQARAGTGFDKSQFVVDWEWEQPGRHLPDGQAEHLLAFQHLSQERDDVGSALCSERLHAVSLPGTMYQGQEGATPPGAASCAAATDNRSVLSAVGVSGRD